MTDQPSEPPKRGRLQFNYIKGPTYREVVCDGAIGGRTREGGLLWMSLFAERGPIPRIVEYEVEATEGSETVTFNEHEAKPVSVESRLGIVRHIEVTAYMNLSVAKRLHKWLGDHIEAMEKEGRT
jgi:hypothetical protein